MTKLSKAQVRVLRVMVEHNVAVTVYLPTRSVSEGAYFSGFHNHKVRAVTVYTLEKKGLIENITPKSIQWQGSDYRITAAGREAIAAHPVDDDEPETWVIYIAAFEYGTARLSCVIVNRQTPKRYYVDSYKDIINAGYGISRWVVKKKHACFETEQAATEWLVKRAGKHVRVCRAKLMQANIEYEQLTERVAFMDD